ncbi:MAG TPA: phosphate acyltransferase PlsX [Vicinamibacterales bacterium]|jgi:phosphate acyltransferase|nr:phosphate acyltransferase PlsX [Vicinamibacterales bacterium]
MTRIAVDAMGGDHAPPAIVDGAIAAARRLGIAVSLVGASGAIEQALNRHPGWRNAGLTIIDAPDVIDMAESPTAVRHKPRASIRVAADLVARGEAVALFSAGHTGATVMATHAAFGMIAGVDRPALATSIPTRGGSAVLLDAGANAECRPQHLLQFAVMGAVYARLVLGAERPRIGLLSIGEEETKGNDLTREAHRLLKASPLNFIGNVEGREIYSGIADVIVCDGFTGNVVLKTSEGLVEALEAKLGEKVSSVFDYAEYGGAPLVGVGALAIVGHGRSSAKAVSNAIAMAHRFAADNFIHRVEQEIASAGVAHQ